MTVGEYDEILCNAYQLYGIRHILVYLEQTVPLSDFIKFSSFVHKILMSGFVYVIAGKGINFWILFDFLAE